MSTVRIVNGLFVTESICYPRSGHQALLDVLRDYFGPSLNYCELYQNPEGQIDRHPFTNYQKNHDFDSETRVRADRNYLVQVRNPLDAMGSRWELELRAGTLQDTDAEYGRVMAEWAGYWSRFVSKWLFSPVPHRLIVGYEDLLMSPHDVVGNVIQFLTGSPHIDTVKLTASLDRYPIRCRRRKEIARVRIA